MERVEKVCLAVWGNFDSSPIVWAEWLAGMLAGTSLLGFRPTYVGVTATGFSDKLLLVDTAQSKKRLVERVRQACGIETIGIYQVPEEFRAVATGYCVSVVRMVDSFCFVARSNVSIDLEGISDELIGVAQSRGFVKKAELLATDDTEEPWFYVTGDNEVEDLDGYRKIRDWVFE